MRAAWLCSLLLCVRASALGGELQLVSHATWNGTPLRLDSLTYPLTSGETVSITRLSMLLSSFALQRDDGTWQELADRYAWFDVGQRSMKADLRDVPADRYRALRFDVGLSERIDAAAPQRWPAEHPLNPARNGMHWAWQGGYIFMAIEGRYRRGAGEVSGFSYHLAREPNRTSLSLPVDLQISQTASSTLELSFDLAAALQGPAPISPEKDGRSTHSRDGDPVAASLRANLRNAFRVRAFAAAAQPAAGTVRPLYLPATYTPYPLRLGATFPMPPLPRDNPLLVERVELGRRLFNDTQLSRTGRVSCASCHQQDKALSDGRRVSVGVDGRTGSRNAMPLFNLAWKTSFFWDGRAPSLRSQALMPIQDHTEMDEQIDRLVAKLAAAGYADAFATAFESAEITAERIGLALENFLLTLVSYHSKFDRAMAGEVQLSNPERRGFELFFAEYEPRTGQYGADCFHCHGGALFTDGQFHNNGLVGADAGLFRVSGEARDRGRFSTPSLRNIALTAPYMHDGRFATLEEVLDHYDRGLTRSPTLDPNLAKHPIEGLGLTPADRQALVAFLKTLTDPQYQGREADDRSVRGVQVIKRVSQP